MVAAYPLAFKPIVVYCTLTDVCNTFWTAGRENLATEVNMVVYSFSASCGFLDNVEIVEKESKKSKTGKL
jgi:hypothetical protein